MTEAEALIERLGEAQRYLMQFAKPGVGKAHAAIEDAIRSIAGASDTETHAQMVVADAAAKIAALEKSLSVARAQEVLDADRIQRLTASLEDEREWHGILAKLNVNDDELIRIKNGINTDGEVKIWGKMLYIIIGNVLDLRRAAAAIRARKEKA